MSLPYQQVQKRDEHNIARLDFSPEEGARMFLRYVGIYLQAHVA
jgi:hypothetical protein